MRICSFKEFIAPGQYCHVASSALTFTRAQLHTHDFHELFWVEQGAGWHSINGQRLELQPGMLVLICPADEHGFATLPRQALQIVNIAFANSTWKQLQRRYAGLGAPLFAGSAGARHHQLGALSIPLLRQTAADFLAGRRDLFAIDRFLLNIMHLVQSRQSHPGNPDMPAWLDYACRQIALPKYLCRGTEAFVELAGRSSEHVCRATRRYTGKTPTKLVNEARMNHARNCLAQTREPIADIAAECGLPNLAHFYALCRTHLGKTPGAYRMQNQQIPGH